MGLSLLAERSLGAGSAIPGRGVKPCRKNGLLGGTLSNGLGVGVGTNDGAEIAGGGMPPYVC